MAHASGEIRSTGVCTFWTSNHETLALCNIDTSILFSSLDKVVNELRSRKSWTISNENQIRKGSEREEGWDGKGKYHGQQNVQIL